MQVDVVINALVAILSGTITASIARFYISRSLDQLDSITSKINDVKMELSAVAVHLVHMQAIQTKVLEHESKIAVIESKIRAKAK